MISKLWSFFIISGSIYLVIKGDFNSLNKQILTSGKVTLDLLLQMIPIVCLWLGVANIAKDSGLLKKLTRFLEPILRRIFPEIPKDNAALGYISSNIIANMFGLGNAATPFGLKAMEEMQKLNKHKDVASRSMITFLVINTCGITLVPTTIISLRVMHDSLDASKIVIPCILVSFWALVIGLIIDYIFAVKARFKR